MATSELLPKPSRRKRPKRSRWRLRLLSLFKPIGFAWREGVRPFFRHISKWAVLVFRALIGWCAGLNYRLLLQGLPALAVAAGALTMFGMAAVTGTQVIEARYLEKARAASRDKNYPEALVCYERLANLKSDRSDALYELALTADAAGQLDRCNRLMTQLAPTDPQTKLAPAGRPGYGKAHFWIARRLLDMPNPSAQLVKTAESHLRSALETDEVDRDARDAIHGTLGAIYLRKGLLRDAEDHLQKVVKTNGHYHLLLMEVYEKQGEVYARGGDADVALAQAKFDRARSEGLKAAAFYGDAARANHQDHDARLRWAEATAKLHDFPQAIDILDAGLATSGNPKFRTAKAVVYLLWYDRLGRKGQGITADRLALLEAGLRIDPNNRLLQERLLAISNVERDAKARPRLGVAAVGVGIHANPLPVFTLLAAGMSIESTRASLLRLLVQGETSSQVHFLLGVDAWQHGLIKEARFHWEEAHKLDPNNPRVANNLAWLLYMHAPKELDKALELSNLAIEKAGPDGRYNDTRGRILMKMGKYREALADLEKALRHSRDNPELHSLLADVYDHLEMTEIADLHRRLALEKGYKKALKQP